MAQAEFCLCFGAAVGMFAEGKVETGASREYSRGVGKFAEAPDSVVCSHAGMACSVEGHSLYHKMYADFVDTSSAILEGLHSAIGPASVAGEEVEGKRVLPPGNEAEEGVYLRVLERYNGQKGREQLALYDGIIRGDGVKYGWGIAEIFPVPVSAENDDVPVLVCPLGTTVVCFLGDESGVVGVLQWGRPDLAEKLLLEEVNEFIGNLFGYCHLIDIDADLSCVEELEEGNLAGGIAKVGILADDAPVPGLTSEFKCYGGEMGCGFL